MRTLKTILKWIKKGLTWAGALSAGLLFAAPIGDLRHRVAKVEKPLVVVSQWASAIAYVSLLPAFMWALASVLKQPLLLAASGAVALVGAFLLARRVSAYRGVPMGPLEFGRRLKLMILPEQTRHPTSGALQDRPWNRWSLMVAVGAAPMAVGGYLSVAPQLGVTLVPADTMFADLGTGGLYAGYLLWVAVSVCVGRQHAARSVSVEFIEGRVGAAGGMSHQAFVASGAKVRISADQGRITVNPVPDPVQRNLRGFEAGVALHMPEYTTHGQTLTIDEITLVKLASLDPATQAEVLGARKLAQDSDGLVLANLGSAPADPTPGGDRLVRRDAQWWKLSPTAKPAMVDAYAREATERVLVEFNDATSRAVVARLDRATLATRERLASLLKCSPWDVEIYLTRVPNGGQGTRINTVEVLRAPSLGVDPAKRIEIWRLLIAAIPGGSNGWGIAEDPLTGRATLTYGEPRALPGLVPGADLLPTQLGSERWSTLPLGLNDRGQVVSVDLSLGPHAAVAGETGSGKSVALRLIMLNALARGFELVVVDPIKKGAGLKGLVPYSKGFFTCDIAEAAAVLKAVYVEVRRRVDLIDDVDGEDWMDLPVGTVRPLMVTIDEFAALVEFREKKPLGLGNDDPLVVEWTEKAQAVAQIQSLVGKISMEARSAGVHLVLSAQQFYAETFGGGQTRANLGSTLQLVAPTKPPSKTILSMLFSGDNPDLALVEIQELNDGRSKGLGVSYAEGGGVQGLRVGFIDKDEVGPYCARLGIPAGIPLLLETVGAAEQPPVRRRAEPEVPLVIDAGSFEFELDDLDEDEHTRDTDADFAFDFAPEPAPALLPAPEVPSTTPIL